jgi:hypothetical protein
MINNTNDLGLPILDVEEEGALPNVQPVFTTHVNEATGQTEVDVVLVRDPVPSDVEAQQVLDALPEQTIAHSSPVDVETDAQAHIEQAEEDDVTSAGIGHNQPADPAEMRRDLFKDVNKFGKASGEGASALGRLGLRVLRAAADGILSTAKPQGGGKDDATLVYEAYTAMDSKHAEHTAGGAKANASKLRQVIAMGCMTTLSDPVAVGDRCVAIRERMEGADLKPKALFAALVDVAREQISSDTELTDAQIEAACTKSKTEKTLEKEWQAIHKKVEGLITGEASHGLKDNSDTALKIAELVDERLKQYKRDETRDDLIETMMERGYTRAQAESIVDRK